MYITLCAYLHSLLQSKIIICMFASFIAGRVLNRFSKDLGQIDEVLPLTLFDFLQVSLKSLIFGLLCVAFLP